jgi:PII-like signaling protein
VEEVDQAFGLIRQATDKLTERSGDPARVRCEPVRGRAAGWAEAPHGEVLYDVELVDGRIVRCQPRSASFHNLVLMHEVFTGDILTDFPFIEPIHQAIARRLRSAGISGTTTHRGFWGFHGDRPPHGDRLLQLEPRVPTTTTVIDTAERIFAAFDIIDELTKARGLVTSETVPAMRASSGHQ